MGLALGSRLSDGDRPGTGGRGDGGLLSSFEEGRVLFEEAGGGGGGGVQKRAAEGG